MIFYLRNVVKYYSKVSDINTIIIGVEKLKETLHAYFQT